MGQLIGKDEPYFTHVGFAYVHQLKKTKMKKNHRYTNLKTRPVVKERLDKLKRYWKRALK